MHPYEAFLLDFFSNVKGIGKKKMAVFKEKVPTYDLFMDINFKGLLELKTDRGRRLLSSNTAEGLLSLRNTMDPKGSLYDNWIPLKIRRFITNSIKNIRKLKANALIDEGAINPFLVKALGISSFDSLARFYVYQRIGRSLVTSFGSTIEHIVRVLAKGHKGEWWDVVSKIAGKTYYMSVKSGPRDMDKDQVQHFAQRAKELLKKEPKALPVIAMGYGIKPLGPISPTLKEEGLDPKEHTLIGKALYERITGSQDYHEKLLEIINRTAIETLSDRNVIDLIEEKVKEMSEAFTEKYKTVDDLLVDVFG